MNDKHKLWERKYCPITLNDYIFHDASHERAFHRFANDKTIPNLLLTGVQGSGKTTIAHILVKEIGINPADFLFINASDENSVDIIRDKIKDFITTWAMNEFKVVLLDEADYISPSGQAVLRGFMVDYSDTARFILTANYENKIIPALKSRTQQFRFKAPDIDNVTALMVKILAAEKVKFNLDILDSYVSVGYPDIRKIINLLQQNSYANKLIQATDNTKDIDYKFELLHLLTQGNWAEMRRVACTNVLPEEWPGIYKFLYENLHKCKHFSMNSDRWEEGIIVIADHLYKHSLVADPEINAAALFVRLSQL